MSIIDALKDRERSGALVRYRVVVALDADEAETRGIWLRPDVAKLLDGDSSVVPASVWPRVHAGLRGFVAGAPVHYPSQVKALKPHKEGVCELRFRFDPESRLIGGFLSQDCFIGVFLVPRKDLEARFAEYRHRTLVTWRSVFGTSSRPMDLTELSRCITKLVRVP